ncbi:Oidioi.mRNA.OKI2018_I69.PAR.g11421.t1.cds [Oikopleura dioica]|uniref:Large ribosomal subunit protein mL64 n=1 Tax=Oikopleura dioica TaxID=34765 RepID=A0ABN7S2T4_OIKDI|nr:Oidioi.mRNA.OKI2018_I69.PAR.g11421.t1.cds [Oikopleura dioica]
MRFTQHIRRLPPPFYPGKPGEGAPVGRYVRNVSLPYSPDHRTPKEETGGYGEHADYMRARVIADERRRSWARFGSLKSQVSVRDLFPSEAEYAEELEAEKRWWPELETMKKELQRIESQKEQDEALRQRQIAAAMSQMPKWMNIYKGKTPVKDRTPGIRQKLILEKKKSKTDYVVQSLTNEEAIIDLVGKKLDPRSMEYKQYVSKMQLEQKNQKKRKAALKKRGQATVDD